MKTIKIKDLYNKIVNDELEDTKFKYDGDYFKYWKKVKKIDRYEDSTYDTVEYYNDSLFNLKNFNDEVEIIEEEKEIEKLDIDKNDIAWCEGNMKTDEDMVDIFLKTKDKINELIDVVNEMRKEK